MRRSGWILAALLTSACSVIAGGGEPASWPCTVADGSDFCAEVAPAGQRYRCQIPPGESEGVCAPCGSADSCDNGVDDDCDGRIDEGSPETCNDADDDCDGVVDNGLDEDGDGFTWCPTGPPPLDCDDSNPTVHPTRGSDMPLREICDGLDNDCDRATGDGSGECDSLTQDCDVVGQRCIDVNCVSRPSLCNSEEFCDEAASPPMCTPNDMTCFNPTFQCAEGQVCNPANVECVTPMPNGTPCDYDAECASSLCTPISALSLLPAHVMDHAGVCSRSCCTDTECDAGQRCWASGSGARACVPESILAMGTLGSPTTALCSAQRDCAGQECEVVADDAYQVRSRVTTRCGSSYPGRRSCSFDLDCCDGFDCLVSDAVCVDRSCLLRYCTSSSQCTTGLCVGNSCRETCATTDDCIGGGACVHIRVRATGESRDDYLSACSYNVTGRGADGASCTSHSDCLDRTCVDATGDAEPQPGTQTSCADICCSDSSCQAGEQCRPIYVVDHWENHCLPEPVFGRVASGR